MDKSSSEKKINNTYIIDILVKDGRGFKFKFVEKVQNEGHQLFQSLQLSAFPERKEVLFAFEYGKFASFLETTNKGWRLYNIFEEFKRQGLDVAPLDSQNNNTSTSKPVAILSIMMIISINYSTYIDALTIEIFKYVIHILNY